ncbi:MAG: hypothetical protein ACOC29_03410, partial [Candidatus Sumerlaeota bacterium]
LSNPLECLRGAVHYIRFSLHAGKGILEQWKDLSRWGARFFYLAALPLGGSVYLKDPKEGVERRSSHFSQADEEDKKHR